jgi:hypothetical protein
MLRWAIVIRHLSDGQIDLDPAIASSVTTRPERVTRNRKDHVRRPAIYAAEAPSVIWRRGKRFWLCANCAATVYPSFDDCQVEDESDDDL